VRRPKPRKSTGHQLTAIDQELLNVLGRLDQHCRGAILTILDIMTVVDRRRANRLIEAVSVLVAFMTRPRGKAVRS
jgi:hypothetical protein